MPAFYKIDEERRLVLSTARGVFSLADAVSHQRKLADDLDFDPSFSQIADFTYVGQFEVTADDIHRFAQSSIFSPVSRRAMLMPNEAAFGIGRMYEILRGLEGQKGIRVFRTLEEALDWVFPNRGDGLRAKPIPLDIAAGFHVRINGPPSRPLERQI